MTWSFQIALSCYKDLQQLQPERARWKYKWLRNSPKGGAAQQHHRVHAIKNNLSKGEKEELEMQMSVAQSVSIPIPTQIERWQQSDSDLRAGEWLEWQSDWEG